MRKLAFTFEEIDSDLELKFVDQVRGNFPAKIALDWRYTRGSRLKCHVMLFEEHGRDIWPKTKRYNELFRDLQLRLIAWRLAQCCSTKKVN